MEIRKKQAAELLGVKIPFDIIGIVENIKYLKKGYLFVVRKGSKYDGFNDIDKALSIGAFIIHENREEKRGVYIPDLDHKVHLFMKTFYTNISASFKIIGVCGTNGKSSIVMYLYEMMKDRKRMKIGTHFIESDSFKWHNENTTPSVITLMHLFHLAQEAKIEYIFMEVSSHAIDQARIAYLLFDYIIYTNISRDHLDYHKTLIHYRYSKYKLTQYLKENGVVIANRDELYYQELKKVCDKALITYGMEASHFQICDVLLSQRETTFYVNHFYFHTQLLSQMNVYNLSACIAFLRMLSISYHEIYKMILPLQAMEGRLEVVYDQEYTIIVDYAHSAKAFYEGLHFFSSLNYHRLILVVGCGGEREKEKRSEIGYYANYFCDICIFTEDNSRYESVYQIMEDMCLRVKGEVCCIGERKKAIKYAIKIAEKNDIILVSGKGNEQFLDRFGEKIPFNDKQAILKTLG